MRAPRARRRAARRRDRPHLRRHRRGRAAGPAGHPPAAARAARGADRGHGLRRAGRRRRLRRHARGRPRRRQRREAAAETWAGLPEAPRLAGRRHHAGAGDGGASGRRLRRPHARLSRGPAGLRPPLHLLHHPLSAAAPAGACRPSGSSAQARALVESGYRELVVTGVDITSYGRDLPGQPSLGAMLRRPPGRRAGAARGCGSPRSTRPRSTPSLSGWWPRSRG